MIRTSNNNYLAIFKSIIVFFIVLLLFFSFLDISMGAKISEFTDYSDSLGNQLKRIFFLNDKVLRSTFLGVIFLAICSGILGSFIVVRKMALIGDTLSHSVLPGVAVGFLWNMEKNPYTIFICAVLIGLFSTFVVNLIIRTTKIKQDAALGIVLASFFGIGLILFNRIDILPGDKSGLKSIFFGQIAALSSNDIILLAIAAGMALLITFIFYHPLLSLSFDYEFSSSLGLPVKLLHNVLMFLLSVSIVVSLQAVGIVLVSAMLIIPACGAYLLTYRFYLMIIYSIIIGIISGLCGAIISMLISNFPTGPAMVISASFIFFIIFIFSPLNGVLWQLVRARRFRLKIVRENVLKTIYHILESKKFKSNIITIKEISERKKISMKKSIRLVKVLLKNNYVTSYVLDNKTEANSNTRGVNITKKKLNFTYEGYIEINQLGIKHAKEIIKKHRLWELFLNDQLDIAEDHVHMPAEREEHILDDKTISKIEQDLDHPKKDPHGSKIPK